MEVCLEKALGSGMVRNWVNKGWISDWLSTPWRSWREPIWAGEEGLAQRAQRTQRLKAWRMMRLQGWWWGGGLLGEGTGVGDGEELGEQGMD